MAYETTGNEPKRSKSLMQRIKKARKEPTVPISALGDEDAPAPSSAMRESPSARRNLGASGGIRREDISAPIATPPPVRPVDPFENAPSDSVLDDVLGYDDYPLGDDDLDNKETLSPLGRSQVSQNGRLAANGLDSPPLAGGSGLGRKPSLVQRMKGLRTR